MMSLQKYAEGEALDSRHAKSNRGLMLRVAVLVVCVLLVSALVVTYLLLELLKTRDMLRNLEMEWETVKADVRERLPEIKPCSTVQPTCPEPEVKIITQPCSPMKITRPKPPEINMITQSYHMMHPTTPQTPEIITNGACYKCEDGWEQHEEKCYYFSISKLSWNESRTECRAKGGDLVKIDSEEKQSFLKTKIERGSSFWIGLTDSEEEGRWLWVDGSPLNERLTFWSFLEPDNWSWEDLIRGEDCVKMGHMYWSDNSCQVTHRSICEKPAVALCV